ncbi:hypothetical protein C2S08_01570 [Helicobacter pylori]|nr:hypothetical protein C2S08_01570 [Helicobacter pylori]
MSSNAFPTGLTHHIYKGVTLCTSYARYKCMEVLYYKDIWDFCLGGFKMPLSVFIINIGANPIPKFVDF